MKRKLIFGFALLFIIAAVRPCTTGLADGSAHPRGRCLLWKNRDSSHRNNEVVFLDHGEFKLIGVINVVANSTTYYGGPFSVAAAFGGQLPDHWGIVVQNESGATLDGSVGSAYYQGVKAQMT